MRLVEFVVWFKRNKGCINSCLVIRSNPKVNSPSYYFRNVKVLNDIFKDLLRLSQISISSFECLFLKYLPECLSQIKLDSSPSDFEVSNQIKEYFSRVIH